MLEPKGSKFSRPKTEYLKCRFSSGEGGIEEVITIRGVAFPRVEKFIYMGSIIQEEGDIDEDINQQIKVGW